MDSLLTPENVTRLWNKPAPAADKTYAAQERAERLADVGARVRDGSYPDTGVNLAAAVASPKLRDDLAKAPVDPDDAVEHAERWDGLS